MHPVQEEDGGEVKVITERAHRARSDAVHVKGFYRQSACLIERTNRCLRLLARFFLLLFFEYFRAAIRGANASFFVATSMHLLVR